MKFLNNYKYFPLPSITLSHLSEGMLTPWNRPSTIPSLHTSLMACSSLSKLAILLTLMRGFRAAKQLKSQGCRSGEYGGWTDSSISFSSNHWVTVRALWGRALSWEMRAFCYYFRTSIREYCAPGIEGKCPRCRIVYLSGDPKRQYRQNPWTWLASSYVRRFLHVSQLAVSNP